MSTSTPSLLRTLLHPPAHSHSSLSLTSGNLTLPTESLRTIRTSKDPQTLLLQRWHRFSTDITPRQLSRRTVIALNRNLDEAEELLDWDAPEKFPGMELDYGGLGIASARLEDQTRASKPPTPPRSMMSDAPPGADHNGTDEIQSQKMGPMLETITHLVDELRKRQEEFKHLHSIAIAKAEQGAEELVQLGQHVEQMEQDFADDESELTYLKLRLRILEIEAAPYVPTRERDSLAEGIRRWKLDWADVDNRFRTRRRKKDPGTTYSMTSSMLVVRDH